MIFNRSGSLGILLTNGGAQASFRRGQRAGGFFGTAFLPAARPLLEPFDPKRLSGILGLLAERLPKRARRIDVPVSIGVPDPLFLECAINFKAFPENEDEARALVEARVAKEYPNYQGGQVSAFQILANQADGVTVLIRTMKREVRDALDACAHEAGFNLRHLEGYCAFGGERTENGPVSTDVSVRIAPDNWFVECVANDGKTFFSQAGWMGEWREDASLILRLIRTFCLVNQIAPVVGIEGDRQCGEYMEALLCEAGFQTSGNLSDQYLATLAQRIAQWRL